MTIEKILIRTPSKLKDILKSYSNKKGLTLNGLILEILWQFAESKGLIV